MHFSHIKIETQIQLKFSKNDFLFSKHRSDFKNIFFFEKYTEPFLWPIWFGGHFRVREGQNSKII